MTWQDPVPEPTVDLLTAPLPIELRRLTVDDRVPSGEVALGSYLGGQLLARNSFPAEVVDRLPLTAMFAEPVPLHFTVRAISTGLEGLLSALVLEASLAEGSEHESWAASVPSFELPEPATEERNLADGDLGERLLAGRTSFPLGIIRRPQARRKFPTDLRAEAEDLLLVLLQGEGKDAIGQGIDDFLSGL